MRILHSADWHIGQTLSGWTREHEHRGFLTSLGEIIVAQQIDALLVAGDVFDGLNPSGEAQRLLYSALAGFLRARPGLQIVLTAGNHDPAQRLEAPEAVLRELGVHVIGTLKRGAAGVEIDRHLIALRDASGTVRAQVLALPFLRQADLPGLHLAAEGGAEGAITAAVRALHAEVTTAAQAQAGGVPLIAMGHLTCAGGLESEGAERRILIGGEHAVPPDIFPPALRYVALGHLHRPQSLDGGRVRYSGSPFPLSASEIGYDHGVTLLDLDDGGFAPRHLPLPRPVAMHRLPARGTAPLAEAVALLQALDLAPDLPKAEQPFLYLALDADRPATQIAAEVEALMQTTPMRLAGLSIQRREAALPETRPPSLAETAPEDLFAQAFQQAHGIAPDPRHMSAFRDALSEV